MFKKTTAMVLVIAICFGVSVLTFAAPSFTVKQDLSKQEIGMGENPLFTGGIMSSNEYISQDIKYNLYSFVFPTGTILSVYDNYNKIFYDKDLVFMESTLYEVLNDTNVELTKGVEITLTKEMVGKELILLQGVLPFIIITVEDGQTVGEVAANTEARGSQTVINLKNKSGDLVKTLEKATVANFKLVFNGSAKQLSLSMLVADGRTYLPLRSLGEEVLEAEVQYDNANAIAIVTQNGSVIETFAGSNKIVVDGVVKDIDPNNADAKAFIRDNRTYIPVRAIAEAFGCDIYWDSASQTIYITNNGTPAKPAAPSTSNPNYSAEEQAERDQNQAVQDAYRNTPADTGRLTGEKRPAQPGTKDGQMSPAGDWMWSAEMNTWVRG